MYSGRTNEGVGVETERVGALFMDVAVFILFVKTRFAPPPTADLDFPSWIGDKGAPNAREEGN